jgi:hypothetical protein
MKEQFHQYQKDSAFESSISPFNVDILHNHRMMEATCLALGVNHRSQGFKPRAVAILVFLQHKRRRV